MPDGSVGASAPQQEAGRAGLIVRASAKLEEFRKVIRELFGLKEGDKKVKGSERSSLDKILAIAEEDVARVKKDGEPLEKILEEAKAGLAGVTLKENLSGAVEGLRRKQREEVEKALKDYREALVEVLKEGENPTMKKEEVVVVPEPAEVSSDKGAVEQEGVAVAVASPERSGEVVARTRDPEEERLVDLVGELTIDGNDPKQAAFLNAAQNADTAWATFEKASGAEREKAKEVYDKAVLRLKNAYTEFQKPKSKRAPRAPKLEIVPREAWMDQVDEYLAGDLKDDQILLAMLLEYEKPSEHVEEYEKLVSLASDAHQKLKKLKFEEGRIPADQNEKNFNDYKESMKAVKAAAAAYIALGESPTTEKTVASGGDFGKDFVARAQAEIAARQEKNATTEQAEDERMQELRAKQIGDKNQERAEEVARVRSAIDDIRRLATQHAEQMIKSGEGSKIATDLPMIALWQEMKGEGVKIQTARALRGFLEGQVEEVVIEDENVPVDKQEKKRVQARVSTFSKEAVLGAARIYGFENEESLLAAAALPLPTEKKTSKGFASEAAEATRNKAKTVRLEKIATRTRQIDTMLAGYKDMGTEPPGWVKALTIEKKDLAREKAELEEELKSSTSQPEATSETHQEVGSVQPEAQTTREAIKTKAEKFIGSASSLGKEKAGWKNQDAFLVDHKNGLFGVFDGIGGEAAGDRASQIVRDYVQSRVGEFEGLDAEAVASVMADIMNKTAKELHAAEQADPALKGMGTTLTLIKIVGNEVVIGQAGDSRVYGKTAEGRLRSLTLDSNEAMDDVLKQFGEDVAFVFQQTVDELDRASDWIAFKQKTDSELKALDFSEDEIKIFRDKQSDFESLIPLYFLGRNVISAWAGSGGKVDIYDLSVEKELLLTSDGIHDNLKKSEIRLILTGQYDKLQDSELRDGLKGIANPTEALTAAAQIRSKQKGNKRAKPDDMTALRVEREIPNTDEEVVEVRDNELEVVSPAEEVDDGVYAEGRVEGRPRKRDKNADGSQAKSGTGNAPDIFDATDFSVEETKSAYEDTGSSATPANPDTTPPVPPLETTRIGIDTVELKTRTEAARAMIDSVKTGIAAWGKDRRDGVGQEYYIKDAVAYLERIIKRDEVFLALATPTEDDERAYSEERKAMVEGDLKRQYDRLFVLALKGSKKPYAEEFPAWIANAKKRAEAAGAKGNQDGRKREEVYAKEIEKRKEVIDAIRPFFEVWLKMETKEATVPVPDATAAPTPDASAAPKPPEATPAPADASSPVPPEAAPATPPAVPKTPDASAAPVPPAAPPVAPPTPDKKAAARPELKFADETLFEGEDGKGILDWLKKHGPLADEAKKLLDDKALAQARTRYAPFAEHATLLDDLVKATTELTQAKTPSERLSREAVLVTLRQKAPGSMRAEVTLEELEGEKRQLKRRIEGGDDNEPMSAGVKRATAENRARLAQIKEDIILVEMDLALERALMEVATMEGKQSVNEIKKSVFGTERREEGMERDWKEVAGEAEKAFEALSKKMEGRSKYAESEKYFGPIYGAFLKEQELTIALNKSLHGFNVLDAAEVHVTQTLRVLDHESSGTLAFGAWNEMPASVRDYLDKAGLGEKSEVGDIKAKLYERLRAITRAKVEADKELRLHMERIDAAEEPLYDVVQEVQVKLQQEDRQLLRQLSQLRAEMEMYKPEKAKKEVDKLAYETRTKELKARLELVGNEQAYTSALLKDSEALLDISKRTLSAQGGKDMSEASALEALKNQKTIADVLVRVMNGQAALGAQRKDEVIREQMLRKQLPSTPRVQGGGASFGKGTPAPENRTSGGKGGEDKSMWQAFMETGFGKGAKEFVEAFRFWE